MQTQSIRWDRLANIGLATWFVTLSVMRLTVIWPDRAIDMRLYLRGTSEWLSCGDPWTIHFGTMHFAAAPPSLLPMVPLASASLFIYLVQWEVMGRVGYSPLGAAVALVTGWIAWRGSSPLVEPVARWVGARVPRPRSVVS